MQAIRVLYFFRYDKNAGWDAAELIETNDSGRAEYPQIAMDASDNAIVVWQQNDGARTDIMANCYK